MALYYTIDEFIKQVQNELKNLHVYTGMLGALVDLEQTLFEQRESLTTKETLLESAMVDADSVLQDVATALGAIDTTKFAFEVRAGVGIYHHADIDVTSDWTINSVDSEGTTTIGFNGGITYNADDVVEILKSGDINMDGFFTVVSASGTSIVLAEAGNATAQDPNYTIIVRFRER